MKNNEPDLYERCVDFIIKNYPCLMSVEKSQEEAKKLKEFIENEILMISKNFFILEENNTVQIFYEHE